ncbi:serine hydrolase [Flammeovirga pectinis]|uniref:Serine hydrolase n=1 Tax=Flammeovirga pectinis TaxID=2494373 RepID=A0A3Q9FV20_9BACT|nr:serine hydrolase [Flammeovirga pectinis]AZQ65073.1 serine hydrolase [Flammeovirga pectinis]
MIKKTLLIAIIFQFVSSLVIAQKSYTKELKKLDKYYQQIINDWEIPSMTVGIVKDGRLIFSKGYGTKEIGKQDTPDENTLYAIASNSKAFTSAIIAMLVQEGKLNWNDKVVDYLPYFAINDPYLSQLVTIEDMLSHRVGLGTFSGDIMWYQSNYTSKELIKRIKYIPLAFELRDGFGYSNLMYITAGQLIKEVTGKSWGENVQEKILDPLGMDRTIYSLSKLEEMGNFATPHQLIKNKENVSMEWTNWEEIAATGGLISSVKDLSKWMIFNINNGIINSDTLLTSSSRNQLWKLHNNYTSDLTQTSVNTHFSGYALGWGVKDYYGNMRVSHTGGYDGMITAITLIPDQKLGVVVLTNGLKSPISAATNYTIDTFLKLKELNYSKIYLEKSNEHYDNDTRIEDIIAHHKKDTKPSKNLNEYEGVYFSELNGNITVRINDGKLIIDFEHQKNLNATLSHWHYDTFELLWDFESPWYTLGTVSFEMDNNRNITALKFDVPNNDFHFSEIKAKKIIN